jgi:hypothetical protein
MELAMTPMTERQRKYRENYRERIAGVQRPAPHPADLHHRPHRAVRWIVTNFDNEWEMTSADIDAAIVGLRRECAA